MTLAIWKIWRSQGNWEVVRGLGKVRDMPLFLLEPAAAVDAASRRDEVPHPHICNYRTATARWSARR